MRQGYRKGENEDIDMLFEAPHEPSVRILCEFHRVERREDLNVRIRYPHWPQDTGMAMTSLFITYG